MADARKRQKVRPIGVARRTRSALMVSTALQAVVVTVLAVPAMAQPVPNAQPTGGVVVGGTAAIAQTANNTTINQTSQRAALNWKSFDVGSQQSVTFQQPNARAIALNTVTGPNPSQIAGRIDANGQVVLVNQSGVTFYKGSQVNTAGLMVSAASADPQAFMRGGNIVFDQAGHPNAQIINNGNITISGAGLASLVAPSVANAGTINARLGNVVLAGAKTATLDLYGDKLVTVNVTGAVTQAPNGGQALVTNTGVIRADGGTVRLTARAVDGVVTNLVTAGGKIQARTVGTHQGDITIDGVGGSITITGDLDATGRSAGTTGGKIGLLASNAVIVKSGAVVDASGNAGGGTIAVGTTLRRAAGGPAVTGAKMAQGVLIQQGATIAANATGKGNGGRVTVLASQLTTMNGTVAAEGGPAGGNGGFVEISGATLSLTGAVHLAAPAGSAGTLLLDPTNLDIVDSSAKGTNIDGEFTGGTLGFAAADAGTLPSSITAGEINTLGATGNVVIQASGSVEFQNTVTAISIANNLTVQAGADLLIDRGVSITTTGVLSLTSGADLITGIATNTGAIALGTTGAAAAPVTLSAGALVMNAGATGINLNDASVTVTGLANFNTLGGGVTQAASGVLSAASIGSSLGIKGAVSLPGTANAIATIASISVTGGGSVALTDSTPLTVAGTLTAPGNIYLQSADPGGISVTGSVGAGIASLASFQADAFSVTGAVKGGTFELAPNTTGTAITLGTGGYLPSLSGIGSANVRIGAVTVPGTGLVTGAGPITIGSSFGSASTNLELDSNGAIAQSAGAVLSAKTLTGNATSVSLAQVTNLIGTLGFFASSGDFALSNGQALLVSGPINVTGAGTLALSTTTGGLTLAGNLSATDTLDLVSAGAISQSGGSITAGTLTGSAATTATLTRVTNLIGTLGAFTTSAGFALTDGQALLVNGAVSDSGAASTLALTTKAGGLTLADTVDATNVLDLVSAGTVSQTGGSIGALALTGSSGGSAVLSGASAAANQIANLGAFTVTAGSFALSSGEAFHVTGNVAASTGDVVLRAAGSGNSIAVQTGAALAASSSGTVSVRADSFANAGAVTGGVFEYAPDSGIALTIGAGGDPLVDLTGIASAVVRLGQARGTVTASSITLDADLDLGVGDGNVARPLDLQANGNISGGGHALRNVTTLTGVANTGSVVLTGATDSVAAIGGFTASGGFTLADTGALSVTGILSAAQVQLSAGNVTVNNPGAISTGAGAVMLVATASTISGTGVITAGTLSGSALTTVNLSGANQIGSLGSWSAGAISLNDSVALTISNTVSATGVVDLSSGGLLTVSTGQTVTGSGVTLSGTGLTIAGLVSTPGTADLLGGTGAITESGTIAAADVTGASAGSLILSGASAGANQIGTLLALTSTTGSINVNDGRSLSVNGVVSAAAGDIVLRSAGTGQQINLTAIGALAAVGTVSVRADQFVNNAGGTITGATFEFAPDTPENLVIGAGTTLASLAGIGTALVRIGEAEGTITANGLTLAANLDLGVGDGGTARALDLESNDGINGGGFALLNVTTLTGAAKNGSVSFSNGANSVATLGSFAVTTGFTLADAVPLTIADVLTAAPVSLTAPNITISGTINTGGSAVSSTALIANTGTISETGAGAIITGTLVGSAVGAVTLPGANQIGTITGLTASGLTAVDNGTLTLAGLVSVGPGGTFDISNANVMQSAGGTLIAGVLTSSGGLGTALLQGTANQIGTVNNFMATGSLEVVDGTALAIAGAVGASAGNVFVTTGPQTVTFAPGGSLVSQSGGTIGILADGLANLGVAGATGVLNTGPAGVFEFAPSTASLPVTLGVATGPSLSTTTGIIAGVIRVGAVTLPGGVTPTVSAASIEVAGAFNANGDALELDAAGSVTQSAPLLNVAALTGSAASYTLINAGNTIAQLGGGTLAAQTGTLAVVDNSNLTVAGTVRAAAGNLFVGLAAGDTLSFAAPGGTLQTNGTRIGVQADQVVNLGTPGATGVVNAGAGGLFELAPSTNLATVTLGAPAGLSLTNLTGITAATLRIGAVTLPGGVTPSVTAGSIAVAGAFDAASITTLDLEAKGPISQSGPIQFLTNLDVSTNGATGDIALGNTLNSIGTIGNVNVLAGNFSFGDAPVSGSFAVPTGQTIAANNVAMTIIGGLNVTGSIGATAAGGNVLLSASSDLNFGVGARVTAGATGLASLTAGGNLSQTGGIINGGSVSMAAGGLLTVAANVSAAAVSLSGANIAISGVVTNGGAGPLSLTASGGSIDETGTLITGTLSGSSTGATTLTGAANQVGTLTGFSAAGFTLNDIEGLTVSGVVNGGASATITDSQALTVAAGGTISATSIALQGTDITIPGVVAGGSAGTVQLVATNGGILETGTLIAGTLSGSSTGATSLTGASPSANQVAAIGNFTAAGFSLNDGAPLSINGVLNGGPFVAIADSGPISVIGAIEAASVSLTGASIAIPGLVTDGGSGTVSLIATGGTISETGTLIAGTLSGSATGDAIFSDANASSNLVARLAQFSAASFLLNDGESLVITGPIAAGGGFTLSDTGNLTIAGAASITAGLVSISDTGVLSLAGGTGITSPGTITITDFNLITLAGRIGAPKIVIDNGAGTLDFLPGTFVQTSGVVRPQGVLTQAQLPVSATSALGFFITTGELVQTGVLTVAGNPSLMRIDATTGISFAPSPNGLVAPKTWLILALSNGAKATGGIDVFALDTIFSGAASSAQLSGSVGGFGGNAAAGEARIAPGSNSTFRINGCPISSVNCILLATEGIPTASPLDSFVIGSLFDPTDQDDLMLPLVSDEIY